jgi:UDP-N-acetylglucosamine 1-carboxyvinyltransferase
VEKEMDKFLINGGKRLEGEVSVNGAKNSALKLMAAAILGNGKSTLYGVPKIRDVFTMIKVLNRLGVKVELEGKEKIIINPSGKVNCEASYDLVSQMRASIIVLGPLLAKLGEARVAMPGGCNIGSRKINLHLRGFELLGAQIEMGHGYIQAKADILKGATILLEFPSVGATENLMMAAVMAKGTTVIENAAREPEIVDLANFLNAMGAKVKGAGTTSIKIQGVAELKGTDYHVMPDRIEAGTLLIAGAITKGDVFVKNARSEHLGLVLTKLKEAGMKIEEKNTGIRIISSSRPKAVDVATLPYPGFPTDLQAQMMTLLSLAVGTSVVTENIFENRFMFVDEINRMGSRIRTQGQHAIVEGVEKFTSAPVRCPDLRAGAALVLAGLAADGTTEAREIYHIDRGYENFEQKLQQLGADIKRVSEKVPELASASAEFTLP